MSAVGDIRTNDDCWPCSASALHHFSAPVIALFLPADRTQNVWRRGQALAATAREDAGLAEKLDMHKAAALDKADDPLPKGMAFGAGDNPEVIGPWP